MIKCSLWCISFVFLFEYLKKGLNLVFVDGNGLDGRITRPNCLQPTRDDKMAPNLDKVVDLPCRWLNSYDLLETKLKLV